MRKLLLSSLVALLVPAAAQAQFQLGLRVGYGLGGGDAFKDDTGNLLSGPGDTAKMSDTLRSAATTR